MQRVVAAVGKVVYDKATADQLIEMVRQASDPAQGIAQATMAVMQAMQEKVKGADPRIVLIGVPVAAAMLAEQAQAAGLVDDAQGAVGQAVQMIQQAASQKGQPQGQQQEPPQGGLVAEAMGA
jgi:hypothetical protein